jgi:hypothetical protein
MFPERVADRLILRVTDVLDESPSLSAFTQGAMIDWLELMAEGEGYTSASQEAATYAMHVGYALRGIEVADGKARDLDQSLLARLEQVRREAPHRHKAELRETVESPETDDMTRELFQRWLDDDAPYSGERDVLDALVAEAVSDRWMEDERRFLRLSGYPSEVWRIFVTKLTGTLNNQLPSDENVFPWQHIRQLVWLGYLLRVGDAVNDWE